MVTASAQYLFVHSFGTGNTREYSFGMVNLGKKVVEKRRQIADDRTVGNIGLI